MPLLRFQNLYEAHKEHSEPRKETKLLGPTPSSGTQETDVVQGSSNLSEDRTILAWEAQTPFGKLSLSGATLATVKSGLEALVVNASYRVDSCKESLGIVQFTKEDVDRLVKSGILDGHQWKKAPHGQLVPHKQSGAFAVYGSLTFTAPTETYNLISQSSAFNALVALTGIGSILGPVERTVSLIVDGALDGIFQDQEDIVRPYMRKGLIHALLRTHAATRDNNNLFDNLFLKCLEDVPAPVRDLCAKSEEEVRTLGIDASQLSAIAEWAFAGAAPRNLVLWNKVESLGAAVVSSFFTHMRVALVDCAARKCQIFDSDRGLNAAPGLAIYQGGDAQQAIEVLHQANWLQPVTRAESKRVPRVFPYLVLSCTIQTSLKLCPGFLQSVGITDDDANQLVNAIKSDAVAQFAREVSVIAEEQYDWSVTSEDNVLYSYGYGLPCKAYDWAFWLGLDNVDVTHVISHQPTGLSVGLGSSTYYGYTAQAIERRPSIKDLHLRYMRNLPAHTHSRDSDVSSALGEVAGLVYALSLSCVHTRDQAHMDSMKITTGLGDGYKATFSELCFKPTAKRNVPRNKCLGALAHIWLNLPSLYIPHWPQSSLGISNSQGAVISAIFTETKSLKDATTKFVVSTEVPDIMAGEKPVVACAATTGSKVQGHGHEFDVPISDKELYDGCWQIYCITTTGGDPPALEKGNLLGNNASVVPVCGFIACGTRWWEYVDLDKAFAVMAESESQSPCSTCASEVSSVKARWLEQEKFLEKGSGGGFSCSLPHIGEKFVIPAYENGLKQSFLCGVFRQSARKLRYRYLQCITHSDADVLIV